MCSDAHSITLMLRTTIYFHVYILLDFPIPYRNASVLCQLECACLHKTVSMLVFFVESNENTYPKGRALMQMYRVVHITKISSRVVNHIRMTCARRTTVHRNNNYFLVYAFICARKYGSTLCLFTHLYNLLTVH